MTGFVSLLIVLVAGLYFYSRQATSLTSSQATPKSTVDVIGVRNDLLAIANAERVHWVSNSKYGSLDELRNSSEIHVSGRAGYSYSAETSDAGFRIIATYSGADSGAPKRMTIDETMALRTE